MRCMTASACRFSSCCWRIGCVLLANADWPAAQHSTAQLSPEKVQVAMRAPAVSCGKCCSLHVFSKCRPSARALQLMSVAFICLATPDGLPALLWPTRHAELCRNPSVQAEWMCKRQFCSCQCASKLTGAAHFALWCSFSRYQALHLFAVVCTAGNINTEPYYELLFPVTKLRFIFHFGWGLIPR